MKTDTHTLHRTSGLYQKLIRLYPPSYLKKHREELLQNFEDLERDLGSRKLLWAFVISDLIKSVTQQYMQSLKRHPLIYSILAAFLILFMFCVWQVIYLRIAHSTFDNYAAFRGCEQITSETDTQGTCVTNSGQSITIVKFNNKWFLQGDLPVCMINIGSHCLINQP